MYIIFIGHHEILSDLRNKLKTRDDGSFLIINRALTGMEPYDKSRL